jgi:hypothetical protein
MMKNTQVMQKIRPWIYTGSDAWIYGWAQPNVNIRTGGLKTLSLKMATAVFAKALGSVNIISDVFLKAEVISFFDVLY